MAVASNDRRGALVGSLREPEDGAEGLSAVVARSLRDEVEDVLRQAIWRGDLRPGEHLDEAALAERLGVSRPPLREVIRTLEAEGLVVSRPRRGAYVSSFRETMSSRSIQCDARWRRWRRTWLSIRALLA